MIEYIVFFGLVAAAVIVYIAYLIQNRPALKHTSTRRTPKRREYDRCESPIERKLFNALTFNGYQVFTQKQVGPYRGDLFIPPKLIIECDGKAYHLDKARDRRRDSYIRKQGYSVMRVSGSRINGDIKGVLRRVERKLQKCR